MESELENDAHQTCPRCGHPLVWRKKQGSVVPGDRFMGCSSYPDCDYTYSEPHSYSGANGDNADWTYFEYQLFMDW